MLKGNIDLQIWTTRFNAYAEQELVASTSERCCVIDMTTRRESTSIRTDASASRGRSEMELGDLKVLLETTTTVRRGSVVKPYGYLEQFKVDGIGPKFDVAGKLDHYEAVCTIWPV